MKLRKTLAAILTGAMLFGLAACGSPSTPSPAGSGSGSGSGSRSCSAHLA